MMLCRLKYHISISQSAVWFWTFNCNRDLRDRTSDLQSQPFLLARLLVLPIAVNSPNLAHQHWEDKKTVKRPNNFDLDCS